MPSADTNVLVRLLTRDDPVQARQAADYARTKGPLSVSIQVLHETTWVLTRLYRVEKADLCEMLRRLLDAEHLQVVEPGVLEQAITTFERSSVGFADCLALAEASVQKREPLVTFDRRLGKLPGAHLLGRSR